jgi:HlyD family secretion protein
VEFSKKQKQNRDTMIKKVQIIALALLATAACKNGEQKSDAFGNFEATETIVSAESAGKILEMKVKEGSELTQGQTIALIDTTELYLKKKQTEAQLAATETKRQNVASQISVLKEQKKNIQTNVDRITKMFAEKSATQQQFDDVTGQANVIDRQIANTNTQFQLIGSEAEVVKRQLDLLDEQLSKCKVASPGKGTVLETYLEPGELASPGKAILKMADLSSLELKVYVSGAQLANVKLGSEVKVLIDAGVKEMQTRTGKVTWISSESEFTPKIIQTKEERVKLMYAVKVLVPNDGTLKIGMPGEVVF